MRSRVETRQKPFAIVVQACDLGGVGVLLEVDHEQQATLPRERMDFTVEPRAGNSLPLVADVAGNFQLRSSGSVAISWLRATSVPPSARWCGW